MGRSSRTDTSGLPVRSDVSTSTSAGNVARPLGQRVAGALQLVEPRALHDEHDVALGLTAGGAAATAGDTGAWNAARTPILASGGRISSRTSSMISN